MVIRLVQDIRKALENDLYFVALSSALTLPDIYGKAAWPAEKSSKRRYILWYDEEIGKYEQDPKDKDGTPYLSGEIIYSLRCSLLHEGNPNVKNDKRKTNQPIDHFSLVIEKANAFNIYSDASAIVEIGDNSIRTQRMSIRRICMIICDVAEAYYTKNRDKFHFNYTIVDWDKVTSNLPSIDMEKFCAELAKDNKDFCYEKEAGKDE